MPHLSRIAVFPIKSFAPVFVPRARIVKNGGLEHDREFALFDADGKFINGKRSAKIHRLQAALDWMECTLCLHSLDEGSAGPFHLSRQTTQIEKWLSGYFDQPVSFRRNTDGGFPDDPAAPGPTVISTATLEEIGGWFPQIPLPEIRVRFRTNLELGECGAFWEDRLFAGPGEAVAFRIGDAVLEGTNPCQRCIVPTRDSHTGEQTDAFSETFRRKRQETLPPWADMSRFNHFYRLAINTRVPASEIGKTIAVGDDLSLP